MKTKTIICALAAASLSLGSLPSFADDHDHDHGHGHGYGHDRDRGHDDRHGDRHDDHRDARDHQPDHYYYGARGPEWHRGGRIPAQYRSRQYVVNDWRGHHLHAPPRGYQWVQVGGDYVMVAIATGIIATLLINQ
jgi:Ni/Co efflux regulator RcnB